jgi:hypothetical protein
MSCQNLSNTVSTQHSDATAATALFIAGGALAASSIATWLFWPKRSAAPAQPKDQSQVVTPFSSAALGAGPVPGGAVVSISGSFF